MKTRRFDVKISEMDKARILIALLLFLSVLQPLKLRKQKKGLARKQAVLERLAAFIKDADYSRAEEFLEDLPYGFSKDADILYNLGFVKYSLNKIDPALHCFMMALKFNPGLAPSHYSLGHLLFHNKEDLENAERHLKKAVCLGRNYASPKYTLGILYCTMGRYKEAEELLVSAVNEEALAPLAYNILGLISFKKKEYGSAAEHFRSSLRLDGKDTDTLINLSNVRVLEKKYEEAVMFLQKAEALKPEDKFIKFRLGSVFLLNGECVKAAEKLTEAIKLDPDFAQAYLQRAMAYKRLGNEGSYLADQQKAISLKQKFIMT